MTLAAGEITSGRGGYTAALSAETGGVLVYLPKSSFSMVANSGKVAVPLVNNDGQDSNNAQGPTLGRWQMQLPLISEVLTTAWFTRAFCTTSGDTDAHNYHTIQNCPDGAGGVTDTHALCKYGSLTGSLSWSPSGMAQAMSLTVAGQCIDPYSGTATPLTAPSAGALSLGQVKGFAQAAFTGATQIASVNFTVYTGLGTTAGNKTGTNSKYPVLCKGLLADGQSGTVTIVQPKNATTIIGSGGAGGTLVVSVGASGNGRVFTFVLQPAAMNQTSTLGPNYVSNSYFLQSVDGTTLPFTVSDM